MLNSKSFLAVDFGAGSLKMAEFEIGESGGLRLTHYAIKTLGFEGSQEAGRDAVVKKALTELLAERAVKHKGVNACAPGYNVFSKFVKLPPVDKNKVAQIIQYEAQQNVPFPLEEVVWDYQILEVTGGGELEVLLVAIKSDVVEGLFRVAESAGLQLQLCDVSPAALCNAFRYNYGDLEDCTMLLDIGAKTSNLLFFEKGKVFSRSINLGANSITQEFAAEMKLKFDDAEKIKIAEGFVSLGGAYEEPENQNQAAISKIARQFMTRLHIQVNQTMQFYRGQQGGSAPQRLFLSGGASIMPYTAQFFAEKLNVPVEYFNPLRNVTLDPSLNLEELAKVAHSMGEVVGLGLRNLANCPVDLNLMPETTLRWQSFNQKKPYFVATVFCLVLAVAMVGWLFARLSNVKQDQIRSLKEKLEPALRRSDKFKRTYNELKSMKAQTDQMANWLSGRQYWLNFMVDMRQILIDAENKASEKISSDAHVHTDVGVWIEKISVDKAPMPLSGRGRSAAAVAPEPVVYGGYATYPGQTTDGGAATAQPAETASTNYVNMLFRAVDLSSVSDPAKQNIVFTLESELRASSIFATNGFQFTDPIQTDDAGGGYNAGGVGGANMSGNTFTFGIAAPLKNPVKF